MELKKKLQHFLKLDRSSRADSRLLLVSGLIGIALIAGPVWFTIQDSRSERVVSRVRSEGQLVVDQLISPVQALRAVWNNAVVQSLAARAIETPSALPDLGSELKGRIKEIVNVQVFSGKLASFDPVGVGLNGFAVLDMLLSLEENHQPQLQYHHSLTPPGIVDAASVMSGDDLVGFMVVTLKPDYLLEHFKPDHSLLGYVGLSQYNGRQPVNILMEVGDKSLANELLDRQSVPGTLFRVEYPIHRYTAFLSGGGLLISLMLAGVLLLLSTALLYRKSGKAIQDSPAEMRPDTRVSGAPKGTALEQAGDEQIRDTPETGVIESEPPAMRLRYDIAERRKKMEAAHQPLDLSSGIFRAYDIRGVIGKTLDAGIARKVGQATGTVVLERSAGPVVVARDGRLSGPYLQNAMIAGIMSTGCDVLNIGAVPTGVLYYAAHELAAGSGVMITGSHNPPDYNGFKIMVGGDPIHGTRLGEFYRRIIEGDVLEGTGTERVENVVPQYIKRIAEDIQLERPLKVVIDCGNGIGGVCAADVLRAIGAEVLPLFDEVDGTFPNHHPDPSEPENLKDLIESVRAIDADLGFALDGDADRLGVVTLAGDIIYADRVMMLFAMDVLDREPGSTIIYDVKCTGHLAAVISQAGGIPLMYKTGHSLIKAKMKETNAPFGGEMSGHFFFKERWYGVDDGIYAAARLLEILASAETPPEAILNALPTSFSTPELKVQMEEGENFVFVEAFKKAARFENASVNTIDGIRVDWPDGWGLVRGSNTTPVVVVRFDAETEVALERIKGAFRSQMLGVDPNLQLPF
jgi:phosphomannomutase/phosphoglucomutase